MRLLIRNVPQQAGPSLARIGETRRFHSGSVGFIAAGRGDSHLHGPAICVSLWRRFQWICSRGLSVGDKDDVTFRPYRGRALSRWRPLLERSRGDTAEARRGCGKPGRSMLCRKHLCSRPATKRRRYRATTSRSCNSKDRTSYRLLRFSSSLRIGARSATDGSMKGCSSIPRRGLAPHPDHCRWCRERTATNRGSGGADRTCTSAPSNGTLRVWHRLCAIAKRTNKIDGSGNRRDQASDRRVSNRI